MIKLPLLSKYKSANQEERSPTIVRVPSTYGRTTTLAGLSSNNKEKRKFTIEKDIMFERSNSRLTRSATLERLEETIAKSERVMNPRDIWEKLAAHQLTGNVYSLLWRDKKRSSRAAKFTRASPERQVGLVDATKGDQESKNSRYRKQSIGRTQGM